MSDHGFPPGLYTCRPVFPSLCAKGQGLACQRGGRVVFRDLDIVLSSGDAVLLLGPNGSGKSSLLRILAGFLPPVAGSLEWKGAGLDCDGSGHLRGVRYLGHLDALKPALTVRENILFWCRLWGRGDPVATLDDVARYLGLFDLLDVPGRFLSAGQRRRSALAPFILAPAPLWLLDEPATALDAGSVVVLEQMMAAHRACGGIVVLSTHTELNVPGARVIRLDDYAARPLVTGDPGGWI